MSFRLKIGLSGLATALLFVPAIAQKPTSGVLQSRQLESVASSPIDTRSFVVQIDEGYRYQPLWPENPIELGDAKTKWNNMPVGKQSTIARALAGPQWPAIGATGWVPPDPDLAVGPQHIVAVVNSSIAFFNKAGLKQFEQSSNSFFQGMGAGSFQFDPKCFFDRVHQRFFILFLEQDDATRTSKLLVAVSDDVNPNGTWHRYRIESKLTLNTGTEQAPIWTDYWLDYPGFGYNKDAFVVTGNMFPFTNAPFGGAQFIVVPTAPLLTGGAASPVSLRHAGGSSVQVAEMISNSASNVYAISRSGSSSLRVYSVNSPSSSPTINFTSVTVPSSSGPSMNATSTNNRTLGTVDGRVFNATWRAGRIVTAHTIQFNSTIVGSRWYSLKTNGYPSSAPTLEQSGNIGSTTLHQFMPAISINMVGSIGVLFTGSNSTTTANLLYAGRAFIDPAGSMGASQLLESSAGTNYTGGRWGDYFGVDVDPNDDMTFWGIGMTVAANDAWRTSIFSFVVNAPEEELASISVNPSTVVGGNQATGTVTLTQPAGPDGATVSMKPENSIVTMPAKITIPAGEQSISFSISTTAPTQSTVVSLSAGYKDIKKFATITVNP